ncbi:uncharacterized protein EDB91DRAFT_1209272 [Suillus paluster]|uniref:uncharacterized protein n=1 Tax=Suillus paluster TaxID=48578 RepID=UPI001B85C948|nr:uncharacterized protein EDB91DRAFT_1209272 [Suillus paluster]KAG1724829.1 hypothetical protein EDB91DRAFT_1209272 [Suillus paluster]
MRQYHPTSPAGSGAFASPTRQNSSGSDYSNYSATVPNSVHTLIAAMKNLQSTLTLWSTSRASPDAVSDAYMQFGVGFNAVVWAFERSGVNTADLHQIPARLRGVLEMCLGEDASPAALEMYQPRIRQHLYELLQGLKAKQGAWRYAVAAGL